MNHIDDKESSTYNDLLSKLDGYCSEDYVPMHMPGAKRNTELFQMQNPYGIDITEIDGFDNLHHATELLAESMKEASRIFGAEETLYLINGSSAGILSAICGATSRGDQILVARNCHISVYHAIYMNGLYPIYFKPACDTRTGIYQGITIEEIRHEVKNHPEVKAVVLTSPTYEGNVSQIKEIAEFLHDRDIILIVDEAHGAHFHMSDAFPESAVLQGADAVIQSIHKTLPSFTQTALLHLNGTRIDRERVKMYWNIYQTTSPSYILMAGIDRCMSILRTDGEVLFAAYVKRLKELRHRIGQLQNIQLIETDDISKIVLRVNAQRDRVSKTESKEIKSCRQGVSGKELYDILLHEYHIQLEMASLEYIIAMTSVGDKQKYYDRFASALEDLDHRIEADIDKQEGNSQNQQDVKIYDIMSDSELYHCTLISAEPQKLGAKIRRRHHVRNGHDIMSDSDRQAVIQGALQSPIDVVMTPTEAIENMHNGGNGVTGAQLVTIGETKGRISGAQVCIYPPGIPLVNPGERITEEIIDLLNKGIDAGLEVMGLREGKILCLK